MLQAKEYHVSPQGSDNNAGTIEAPFKTINRAAQKALPGDVVTVHEGVYREWIKPMYGGTSDNRRIVYQAAKGKRRAAATLSVGPFETWSGDRIKVW